MPSIHEGIYGLGRRDQLACRDTAVHSLDPGAKVVTTLVFLVCVISFPPHAVVPMLPFLLYAMYLTLLCTHARAQRIYQAMLARGFDGRVRANVALRFFGRDAAHVFGWSAVFIGFRLSDVPLFLGRLMTRTLS